VILMRGGAVIAQGAPRVALTPVALSAAYGRKGQLVASGAGVAAAFE
jgi:ABC-type cobalamin/Fe3+-siderophores transport system ATPase subunit